MASWLVQVGIDIYRFFSCITSAEVDRDENYKAEQARLLGRKVFGVTVRCGASLVFASIGAGIGSTFVHPSAGQWIGKHILWHLMHQIVSDNLNLCIWMIQI